VLGTLSISINGGGSFAPAILDAASGSYTATLAVSMPPASYELQSQDDATDVQSNLYPFTINPAGAFPLMVLAFA
jgi:hypothetical protein